MFKKKKTPNYLQLILIIFAVVFALLLAMAISFDKPKTENRSTFFDDYKKSPELEQINLITYVKQNIVTEPTINSNSPILGNPQAKVTIFEFSSYGCPASKNTQPILKQLLNKYPNEIKIVWKDLPISDLYKEADLAHTATRCAGEQNKFWQYQELVWENQNDLSFDVLKNIAKKIALNMSSFESCIENKEVNNIINNDIKEAGQLSISGTPHFYINSQEIFGSATLEDFERLINIELNR